MSLLNPTPGAVIDRIIIIELKVLAFEKAGKDARLLRAEWEDLQSFLHNKITSPNQKLVVELQCRLTELHKELWACEDEIRNEECQEFAEVARIAKTIAWLNDQRIRLIRKIDAAYGSTEITEEKIYNVGA